MPTLPTPPNSDHTLLSHIIGGKDANHKSNQLLAHVGDVKRLSHLSIPELMAQGQLTEKMATRLYSAFTLGQRSLMPTEPKESITRPEQVYQLVWPGLIHQDNEFLIGLFLNRRKHLIQQEVLTRGTDWMTIVDPKQVYHKALMCRASGLILVHNHPSGDPTPSEQDLRITQEISKVGKLLRIPLLDHLIVGGDSYVSFAGLGLLS